MFCSECGNEMKETREAVKEEFKGQEFEIRGIRHYACDACGETSFDADALDELYTRLDEKYRELHGFRHPARNQRASQGLRSNANAIREDDRREDADMQQMGVWRRHAVDRRQQSHVAH